MLLPKAIYNRNLLETIFLHVAIRRELHYTRLPVLFSGTLTPYSLVSRRKMCQTTWAFIENNKMEVKTLSSKSAYL
jgi:hypothetical protein